MKLKPFPHQIEGKNLMIQFKSCIQADDMGLGKTMQTILAIDEQKSFPCLIICPASLKINWEEEVSAWSNRRAIILNDSIKNTFPLLYQAGIADYFIVNYESLKKFFVIDIPKRKDFRLADIVFNKYKDFFKSVVIDESHRIKDPTTIQAKITAGMCINKKNVYCLSGTPVLNKTIELATQLIVTDKIKHFGGYKKFMETYTDADEFSLKMLQKQLLENCMIRREKKNVLNLPPKTRQIIYVDIDNRDEYNAAKDDLRSYLRDYKGKSKSEISRSMRGEVMVRIGLLKQISGRGKIKAVMENIQSLFEQGEKVVLFGDNIEVLDPFKSIQGAVSIVGGMSVEDKQQSIDLFQKSDTHNLAVCSLKAAGVGVTLTAGRINCYIQMGWHAGIMEQAEDRQNRIGQKREVHCIYFIARNTIDKYIYDVIEKKREICNSIVGTTNDIEWEVICDVLDLLESE